MDGNGRWARQRHLPRSAGHRQGVEATRRIVEACGERGVEVLTLFAFSSENWQRPKAEILALMELFSNTLRIEARRLAQQGVKLRLIGDRSAFSSRLIEQIERAEHITSGGDHMRLNIAANYGGRWDLVQVMQRLAAQVAQQQLEPSRIDPALIDAHLSTAGLIEPDLFIRTGGERRISNFLLWQLAYTELYFTDVLWPDFNATTLEAAFEDYAARQRRFGKTSEQVATGGHA